MKIDLDIKPLIKPKKKTKFGKYAEAIERTNLVPWLRESIEKSSDKYVRILTREIAREMGEEFEEKSEAAIYWGVKFILFHEDIIVDIGMSNNDESMLVMRKRNKEDKLPYSLKNIEKPNLEKNEFKVYNIFK